MRAHSLIALSALFTLSAFAAEVRLGPETPWSQQQPEAAQIAPLVATSGDHVVALWRNADGTRVDGVADGHPFFFNSVALPITSRGEYAMARIAVSLAAGEQNALVVWTEGEGSTRPLYARRIGFGGEILDPVAISLGNAYSPLSGEPQGVAYDNGAFVVAWPEMPDSSRLIARIARISPEGTLLRDPDIENGAPDLRPLHTAAGLIIATAGRGISCAGFCRPISWYGFFSGRTILNGGDGGWAVAAGADRLTFVSFCSSPFCRNLAVAQASFAGVRLSSRDTSITAAVGDLALAWNGGEYVLAWSEQEQGGPSRIRAIRLDANGAFLDPAPFDVSAPGAAADKPSLAAVPGGVIITYSRRDSADGVPRAYARTLERLPSGPRRRATRH